MEKFIRNSDQLKRRLDVDLKTIHANRAAGLADETWSEIMGAVLTAELYERHMTEDLYDRLLGAVRITSKNLPVQEGHFMDLFLDWLRRESRHHNAEEITEGRLDYSQLFEGILIAIDEPLDYGDDGVWDYITALVTEFFILKLSFGKYHVDTLYFQAWDHSRDWFADEAHKVIIYSALLT